MDKLYYLIKTRTTYQKFILFISLNICLLNAPSYSETSVLEIPVVPEEKVIQNKSEKNFKNSEQAVENPVSTNVNTEIISPQLKNGEKATTKSIEDIARQIKSGTVRQYGGENGFLEIHLRGARAFQPNFYFNGLPLASALNGEQNLKLLPSSSIATMNVYPDSAPFELSSMGIGGDVDVISCTRSDCFDNIKIGSRNLFKLSSTVGSYGYKKINFSHALTLSKQTQTFETVEYTQSLENYPVFNNQNSSLHAQNGTYEELQNNNFKNLSAATRITHFYKPLGKLNLNLAGGSREQGVPGTVGTFSTTRLKQNLIVGTLQSEKVFPKSGTQWTNQIGGLFNSSKISSFLPTFSNQGSSSTSSRLQAKTVIILPSEFILQEQTGFAFELLNSTSNTNTSLITNPNQTTSQTQANRLEYRPSIFEGLIHHLNDDIVISANANAWVSGAQEQTNINCNSNIANCSNQNNFTTNVTPIYGYTFSFQSEIYTFIPYARYTVTQRRPYLGELYGSPGGILANHSLTNEQSKKEEVGIRFPYGETGIFHTDDKNLIFLQQASPLTSQYINLQSGSRTGYFLNIDYNMTKYWDTSINYQYLNTNMVQNGENFTIPRSPKHTANFSTSLKNIPLANIFQQTFKLSSYADVQYESPFYIDTANRDEMSVPLIYNAGFSFILANSQHKYLLSMDIFNLTDERFSSLYNSSGFVLQVNSNGYLGVPPPGRRIYLSLTGEF